VAADAEDHTHEHIVHDSGVLLKHKGVFHLRRANGLKVEFFQPGIVYSEFIVREKSIQPFRRLRALEEEDADRTLQQQAPSQPNNNNNSSNSNSNNSNNNNHHNNNNNHSNCDNSKTRQHPRGSNSTRIP
jgi:hypothetical protein